MVFLLWATVVKNLLEKTSVTCAGTSYQLAFIFIKKIIKINAVNIMGTQKFTIHSSVANSAVSFKCKDK